MGYSRSRLDLNGGNQPLADPGKKSGKLNYLYKRYFNNSANPTSKYTLLKKGAISPFDEELKKESKFLDWDWRLLAALIYNESRFDPEAESQVGAYGLMQVIPETASMFNVFDYFQPDSNIYTGVRYLKYLDNIFLQYPIAEKGEDQIYTGFLQCRRRSCQRRHAIDAKIQQRPLQMGQ